MAEQPTPVTAPEETCADVRMTEAEHRHLATKLSPSASFARTLKQYAHQQFIKGSKKYSLVVSFDHNKFTTYCDPASHLYNPEYCNYDDICTELFTFVSETSKENQNTEDGEAWASRDLVKEVIDVVAKFSGFTASIKNEAIICNRYGEDKSKRDFSLGALKSNCTWKVAIASLVKEKYFPTEEHSVKRKPSYRPQWDHPVRIVSACTHHGGTCTPGKQNLIITAQRGKKFINNMPQHTLFNLCNLYESCGKLNSSLISHLVKPIWPKSKPITKNDVFNIRVKVKRLLPTFKKIGGDYDRFKDVVNASDFLGGIDNEVSIDDDEAYDVASSLCLEIMNSASSSEDGLFSFIEYLKLIQSKAKGFTYKLAEEFTSNGNKKIVGVVWQTATMRRNFELFGFGDFIGLDMMKRGINTLLWPYFAVTMYDEMGSICIGCEGILCGEREDMYKFACDFIGESTPQRPLSSVLIVAGDAFFDPKLVLEMGFTNATFIMDQWHLRDSGLEKMFGKQHYRMMKEYLEAMVLAMQESAFECAYNAGVMFLQSRPNRDEELESKFIEFANRRATYSSYLIAEIPGNRGYHGNACSESNHSSVLSYLNDGSKGLNTYCEHPMTLIKDLLLRQQKHTQKKNLQLAGLSSKMNVIRARLANQPQTNTNKDLLIAAGHLNFNSFQRYEAAALRAEQDLLLLESSVESESGTAGYQVRSNRYSEAPPRLFKELTDRCNCPDRVSDMSMCAHEIKAKGGFQPGLFLPRHFQRKCVSGSLEGWSSGSMNDAIDDLIGCLEEEDIHFGPEVNNDCSRNDSVARVDEGMEEQDIHVVNIPYQGSNVKPLDRRHINNVFQAVSGAYNSFTIEQKFDVSRLVLELQQKMSVTGDESQMSQVQCGKSGFEIDVPSQTLLTSKRKARAKPLHEIRATSEHKRLKKGLQRAGIKQDVTDGDTILVANGKQVPTCGFCKQQSHKVTNCPCRAALKMIPSTEYALSASNNEAMVDLQIRLEEAEPTHNAKPQPNEVFDHLSPNLRSKHFLVLGVYNVTGTGSIGGKLFKVSFIDNGERTEDKWITGQEMFKLTTHGFKKCKYIYCAVGRARVSNGLRLTVASV